MYREVEETSRYQPTIYSCTALRYKLAFLWLEYWPVMQVVRVRVFSPGTYSGYIVIVCVINTTCKTNHATTQDCHYIVHNKHNALIMHTNTLCLKPSPLSGLIQQTADRWQFSQKTRFDTSCNLSPSETICKRCQNLFAWKNVVCWLAHAPILVAENWRHILIFTAQVCNKTLSAVVISKPNFFFLKVFKVRAKQNCYINYFVYPNSSDNLS